MIRSKKEKTTRITKIIELLKEIYPEAVCALEYGGDPWRLLVMGRLSAQCTDARVNIVCKQLFAKYPDSAAMADADIEEIEKIVRPCGLYRSKAESIKEASRIIAYEKGGRLPDSMEELLLLPGVGRKIANLLLGDVYGLPAIVCDTHCMRICGRLGFYSEKLKDPLKIEFILKEIVPSEEGSDFCHRIVNFGRDVCTARSPRCGECTLAELCERGRRYKQDGKT